MTIELNPMQTSAKEHIEGPLLILAGAGSGKTRVVTARIAYLLSIGIPSSEILAVTFTNKAAEEMRDRVRSYTNQAVLSCTFHSLCARILRESISHIGFKNDFSIYDEKDSLEVIKTCLKDLGYPDDKSVIKSMKGAISQAKNDLLTPDEIGAMASTEKDRSLKEVYSLYQQKLKSFNALDFDDLLFLTVKLLRDHEAILSVYQNRWRFILVDEYQDTNYAQYLLTNLLAKKHQNILVVGDPDQSIYSWRGANISNILNFEKDYPGAKVIKLEQNYRSTATILEAANALIANNSSRSEKNLWSDLGDGDKIEIYLAENEREEASFVVSEIPVWDRGNSVIFYRTNSQSRVLEDTLLRRNIPYKIIGGLSFYQRKEIKDIIAYLKVASQSHDFLSFARTINLPKRGFGKTSLEKIRLALNESPHGIIDLLRDIRSGNSLVKLSKKQQMGLNEYLAVIDQVTSLAKRRAPLKEILIEAIEGTRYLDYLKEDKLTYEERKENIDELIAKASEQDGTLTEFLEELSLKSSLDEEELTDNHVKMMTLHNGKGLEFDRVFLVGLEEDLLPHVNSQDSAEALEEERRLCYVGMTRAKKKLYLTGAKYRVLWGMPKLTIPSRFLSEIPEDLVHSNIDKKPKSLMSGNYNPFDDDFDSAGSSDSSYKSAISGYKDSFSEQNLTDDTGKTIQIGAIVFHKNFGKGIIKKVYSTSLGTTYDVHFYEHQETRSLVAKYAKLTLG